MSINPDPTVTAVDLSLPRIGTFHATVTTWEMVAVVTSAAQTFNVPSGRYLATLMMAGLPGDVAPKTLTWQLDTGASATQIVIPAQKFRHLRGMSNARQMQIVLDVQRWNGTKWVRYSTTNLAAGLVNIPAAAIPAAATLPKIGASCGQIYGPVSGMLVYPQVNLDGGLQALADMGANITRNDPQWMLLQPTSRAMDPTIQAAHDAYFNSCAAKGLKVIVFLEPIITSPAWAAAGGIRGNMPVNWTDFENYVTDFLARWGTNIAAVELINEPNIQTYPNGGGSMPIADYVTCLQHLYTAVKAYSSSMPVLAACLSYADTAYLTALYGNAGFKGHYDAISIHPYAVDDTVGGNNRWNWVSIDPSVAQSDSKLLFTIIESVTAFHEVMRANGEGEVPLWVTEIGWHTGRSAGVGGVNSGYDVSEPKQAEYLAYAIRALSRLPYIAGICIYACMDTAPNYLGCYGIVDYWGTRRKPAVSALTTAIAGLKAGTG